ncbi:DinB family protein [Streptomyces sp. Je 1-79]|uniref:mycothiol transferase n=1 Tax=Streptomyces sp. Je 1-79 TaxID=2943847 RepID=UPI0021A43571|nr:DinB family protein [Streptomyces sp. Je 1-79]MCT4355957.1 DinB family protein [Streptomyces sp. Je 1-79]
MRSADLLVDAFGRVQEAVHGAVEGLSEDELAVRLDEDANSIAWLVWHLTRVQDDHVAGVFGTEQVWTEAGWKDRFGLPFSARATGFGHSSSQVAKVRAPAELLLGYYDAVHERSLEHLGGLTNADLGQVVDEGWDPPVTLGVRLVSVVAEGNQHAGQAAYVRGVVERRASS